MHVYVCVHYHGYIHGRTHTQMCMAQGLGSEIRSLGIRGRVEGLGKREFMVLSLGGFHKLV